MSAKEPKNVAASVLERLRNKSKSSGAPFQQVLRQYAIERFLHRSRKPTTLFINTRGRPLDDPSFTAPIYANLFEGDDATGEGNLCSQTSIDCWAEIPAVAPCDDAKVTEGMRGLARSPAA